MRVKVRGRVKARGKGRAGDWGRVTCDAADTGVLAGFRLLERCAALELGHFIVEFGFFQRFLSTLRRRRVGGFLVGRRLGVGNGLRLKVGVKGDDRWVAGGLCVGRGVVSMGGDRAHRGVTAGLEHGEGALVADYALLPPLCRRAWLRQGRWACPVGCSLIRVRVRLILAALQHPSPGTCRTPSLTR